VNRLIVDFAFGKRSKGLIFSKRLDEMTIPENSVVDDYDPRYVVYYRSRFDPAVIRRQIFGGPLPVGRLVHPSLVGVFPPDNPPVNCIPSSNVNRVSSPYEMSLIRLLPPDNPPAINVVPPSDSILFLVLRPDYPPLVRVSSLDCEYEEVD
jgi:hypothetical protein